MFAMSALCFVLHLIDRLMQVKNVELSTPRGFNTVLGNFNSNSTTNTLPGLTIKLTDGDVLDAFKTMNFHRMKMNEYLFYSFLHSHPTKYTDNGASKKNVPADLIQDIGSNSYKMWLMRMISSTPRPRERIYTRDYDQLGYTKGHFTEPFYGVRNNVEDEDIYLAMSFPAYHDKHQKHKVHPYQSTFNRTSVPYSKIPISLPTLYNDKHYVELEPNKNIIGINLYDKVIHLTKNYRRKFETTHIPRIPFQQSNTPSNDPPTTLPTEPNPLATVSISSEIVPGTYPNRSNIESTEVSIRNARPIYDNGENVLLPPMKGANNTVGYPYAPRTDNGNAGTYANNQFYPVLTENPIDITYPPYYPPYQDTTIAASYGYPVPTTEPMRNYGPPHGEWHPEPPESHHPYYGEGNVYHPFDDQNHEAEEIWYLDHPPKHNEVAEENAGDGENEIEDIEDGRLSTVSNILGSDAYELILTAIAFMAFGTYFINMMMKITEPNSAGATMMIVGNGNDNNGEKNIGKFFNDDNNLQLLDQILVSIEEFQEFQQLLTANRTRTMWIEKNHKN